MKYVVSNTGHPFQFTLSKNAVYSFDVTEPTAISGADYEAIVARTGPMCFKEVDAPVETPAPKEAEASAETVE